MQFTSSSFNGKHHTKAQVAKMKSSSHIILICSIAAKAFGCINIYPNAEKYRVNWWINVVYKCFVSFILVSAIYLQRPAQMEILNDGSKIVMGKIVVESHLFWITLYGSFFTMAYFNKEIDAWILKCSTMQVKKVDFERNLKFCLAFSVLFSILIFGFYALGALQSDTMYVQAMASSGYFINRITVFFINQTFTTGVRVLSCLFKNVNTSLKKLEERAKGWYQYVELSLLSFNLSTSFQFFFHCAEKRVNFP